MKKIVFILLILIYQNSSGQNRNSVWVFGDSAGIDFSNISNPIPIFSGMDERGSCASISDSIGNLLFYTFSKAGTTSDSGTYVFNYINDTMLNGTFLAGQALYSQVIIVPLPDDSNKYYVFHLGYYSCTGLYYSIVDMAQNNGLGKVIQKNILINNLENADCIQAVRHGNGRDWWLINKLGGNGTTQYNRFFVSKITSGNISPPIIQNFSNAVDATFQKMTFNSSANKLMNVNVGGYMCEFDFDRCTGTITNPNIIFPQQTSNFTRYFVEGAYSPNDSLYYVSTWWYSLPHDTSRLLQYDLFSPSIISSCDTLLEMRNPIIFGSVRLAPNHKIYMTGAYNGNFFPPFPYPDSVRNMYNENLSVINSPNILGAGCNLQPFSFSLSGKRTYISLPNNPNYELGRLVGSPCDTVLTVSDKEHQELLPKLFVFYHNSCQKLFVNAQNIKGKNSLLKVFDMNGKEVFSSSKQTQPPYFTQDVNCSAFASGMYVVSLITEKERLVKKFVKE